MTDPTTRGARPPVRTAGTRPAAGADSVTGAAPATSGAHGVPGQPRPSREEQVLERIERARRRRPKIKDERITLAHGAGGKATQTLIEALFVERFRNPLLEPLDDAAVVDISGRSGPAGTTGPADVAGGTGSAEVTGAAGAAGAVDPAGAAGTGGGITGGRLAFTTDSYVVSPIFFPGGDIGDLAVNGTVNDLAVCGARPLYLSAGFILEEGFPVADLERVVDSMAAAADRAGVQVVTGDTKVVERGKADGCYITTAGVGVVDGHGSLGPARVRPGDAVIVSGPIGEHGITIMLARGELDIDAELASDTAALHEVIASLRAAVPGVRLLRDATRGGVATILNEVARDARVGVVVEESALPVRPVVHGACELLGIDPLYVACEGRFVAVVDGGDAEAAVASLRAHPLGAGAAVIGRIADDPPGIVLSRTAFGGTRIIDVLVGDPLPRIC